MRATAAALVMAGAGLGWASAARAQPVNGFYVGGGLGATWTHGPSAKFSTPPGFTPAPTFTDPTASAPAPVGQGSVGYGLGNGLRFEVEGSGSTNRLRLPQWP